jgi:hypothetical protein
VVSSAEKLSLYKGALRLCEARSIATLTDDVEQRYVLDEIWDDGAIDACLEQGLWNHAMRTILIDCDAGFTDPLNAGWQRFTKPDDWVSVAQVSTDPSFTEPDLNYQDEGNYIYSYNQTLYIRYVSNDASYGNNYSLWPESFKTFVHAYMGLHALPRLSGATTEKDKLERRLQRFLTVAKGRDAMKDPTKFPPETSWNRSRRGVRGMRSNRDYSGL